MTGACFCPHWRPLPSACLPLRYAELTVKGLARLPSHVEQGHTVVMALPVYSPRAAAGQRHVCHPACGRASRQPPSHSLSLAGNHALRWPVAPGLHGRPITAATQCNCCGNRQTALLHCFSGILSPPGKRFHLRLSLQSFCISAVGFQYVPFDIAIWPVLHHRTGRFARPYGPSCAQARLAALPRAAPVVCRHAARLPSRR